MIGIMLLVEIIIDLLQTVLLPFEVFLARQGTLGAVARLGGRHESNLL
jgi:hypothetical protein